MPLPVLHCQTLHTAAAPAPQRLPGRRNPALPNLLCIPHLLLPHIHQNDDHMPPAVKTITADEAFSVPSP